MAEEEIGARLSLKDRRRFAAEAQAAGRDVEGIGEAGEKSSKKMGIAGKAMLGVMGAVTVGIAGLATGLLAAMDVEKANDKLTAQLGLTAVESERIGGVAGALYAGAYGENLGEVNGAVAAVMSSFDGMRNASSADLQALTANALDFATAMDVDVAEAARTAGILVKTGLAKDAKEAFDLLTVASQEAGPAMVQPIMEAASEYGVNFNAMGISGRAAMAILVDASKGGEIALDKAGDAVKEFAIRATDLGDKGAQSALTDMGLSGRKMADDLLAGGDRAQGAFTKIVSGLQKIKSPADQAQASVALFGTPLEDLSKDQIPVFLEAMSQAGGELENVAGAIDRTGAVLNDNAATNLESFKRQVSQTFVDFVGGKALPIVDKLASTLAVGLGPALDAVGATLGTVGGVVSGLTGFLSEHETTSQVLAGTMAMVMIPVLASMGISWGLTAAAAVASAATQGAAWLGLQARTIAYNAILVFAIATGIAGWLLSAITATASALVIAAAWLIALGPIGLIIAGIALVIAIFVLLWQHSETFRNIVTGAFNAVLGAASSVWNWIKSNWPLLLAIITGPFGLAVLAIVRNWDAIKGGAGAAKDWVVGKFNEMVGFVTGMPGRIGAAASGMFDGIKNSFRSAINFVIDKWNGLSFSLPSIDTNIPGIGKVGGFALSPPNIPRLHTGGTLTSGGAVNMLPGEEIVVLPPAASVVPMRDDVRTMAAGVSGGGSSSQRPIVLQVVLDRKVLAEAVYDHTGDKVARV